MNPRDQQTADWLAAIVRPDGPRWRPAPPPAALTADGRNAPRACVRRAGAAARRAEAAV